jgi:lipopolysaccharide exporter
MKLSAKGSFGALIRRSQGPTNLVAITYAIENGIRLVSSLVLTRLLAPEAYAVMGLVTSLAFVITMLTDVGFQAFMLRHERLNERAFRDAMWTTRFLRSCLLGILFFSVADPLGAWLQKPEAIFALQIFSITFFLDGLVPISNITALIDNRLRNYCIIDILLSISNLAISFLWAWLYPNIYSLIYAALVSQIIRIFLFRIFLPDSFLVWAVDFATIKDIIVFGRYIIGSSIITIVILQVDKIGLSRVIETDRLGAYFLAAAIAAIPRGLVNAISSKSLYPAYSKFAARSEMYDPSEFYNSRKFLDKLFSMGCLFGFFVSTWLIEFFYDPRYFEAGLFLSLLFFGCIPLLWTSAINDFLIVSGWTSTTFKTNVVRLAWVLAVALPFLLYQGPMSFLTLMAFTEFLAYIYLLLKIKRLGIIRLRNEIFCIGFALISIILFGFSTLRSFEVFPL